MATEPTMEHSLIEEVAKWKLEAKLEDVDRYFYFVEEVQEILTGAKAYVIGRKGTGKTAISEFLFRNQTGDQFTEKLSFKNFPFNELYALRNESFNSPNQYITVWKYLIYTYVCKMMLRNEKISVDLRTKLKKIFSAEPTTSLSRTISRWTSGEFGLQILGSGISVKVGGQPVRADIPLPERVEVLEDLILREIDQSYYFIMFDELDEDYKNILTKARNEEYFHLLTSLFKAVQDVRAILAGRKVFPVIFLRDDIYDFIRDADKNKWKDFQVELEWNVPKIKHLLAFRISRAGNPNGVPMPYDEAWPALVEPGAIRLGNEQRRHLSPFDYIARSTHLRPRDFIRYLQFSAQEEIQARLSSKIRKGTLIKVDKAFSNYLKDEIVDEIYAILPEIQQILDIFSQIRKQTLTQELFRQMYRDRAISEGFRVKDPEFVLRILFHFSVIGNQPRQQSHQVFHYLNRDARLNQYENIIIHRGLFKALGIV